MSKHPTPAMKALRRLLRKTRARNLRPAFINHSDNTAIVLFAGRHARIRDDGSIVPDMMMRHIDGKLKADQCWKSSCYARWHTMEIEHAAWLRRQRWYPQARAALAHARKIRESENA